MRSTFSPCPNTQTEWFGMAEGRTCVHRFRGPGRLQSAEACTGQWAAVQFLAVSFHPPTALTSHRKMSGTFTPGRIPPPTPGPNRVHRPREDLRYTPYEPVLFPTRGPSDDENRAPTSSHRRLSPSPFTTSAPSERRPGEGSAPFFAASRATNVAPSAPTRVDTVLVKVDRFLDAMDLWSVKDDAYAFAQVCLPSC